MKIDVAGLKIDAITKQDLLAQIAERVSRKQKTFVVTPYSEFLYASLRSKEVRALFNSADFSIPDGVGVIWAHAFMSQPITAKNYYLKVIQTWCQVVWTGASILLSPKSIYKDIPEKIVGADLAWDLAELAAKNNFSVYILGGHGETDKIAAQKLLQKFPNLKIAGTSNKKADDPSIFSDLVKAAPDMILVGLGPITQEKWIAENLKDLPSSFGIGLGGTFDYIAGVKVAPPKFVRAIGLEWLYRLITQPARIKRIFNATWGLILGLVRVKVHDTFPLRSNACAVVVNSKKEVLLCQKIESKFRKKLVDYWQFPQGGIDENENPVDGAQRELREETGISSVKVIGHSKYTNIYIWENSVHPVITPKQFRYRGQKQITTFFLFEGDDSEIQIDMDEFVSYRWVPMDQVITVIHQERREHAKIVLAELAEIQV